MKHRTILPKLWALIALFSAAAVTEAAVATEESESPKITFCYQDTELFPNYMGEQKIKLATMPGINIELVDKIAQTLNIKVQYVRYPWNRCLALLKAGRVDSLIASYNKDRAEYAVYPMAGDGLDLEKRINTLGYYMYHTAASPVWSSEGLINKTMMVAAPLGYSVVKVLRDREVNVVETGSPEDVLKLLLHKRVDAIAAPGTTADALIRANMQKYSMIKKDLPPITERPYFIAFSRKFSAENPAFTMAVWQQTAYVRGTFRQQLIDKYYEQPYR